MRYSETEFEHNTYSSLVVDITHRCNMKCANCYIPNRHVPDLDTHHLFENLKRLPRKTWIRLIGAEPTMREDLPEIVRGVIALGHRPSVTTNGLKLADEPFLLKLKEAGLRYVYISMNGADDDHAYQELDNGSYARLKVRALENLIRHRYHVAVGCIIASGINEHCVRRLPELLSEIATREQIQFGPRYYPTLRFKSVGAIGRYMQDRSYTFSELKKLVSQELKIEDEEFLPCAAGSNTPVIFGRFQSGRWKSAGEPESYLANYTTARGPVSIRLINWDVDQEGVVNAGNPNRGRVTPEWKIAPFFEHVKRNEFGY